MSSEGKDLEMPAEGQGAENLEEEEEAAALEHHGAIPLSLRSKTPQSHYHNAFEMDKQEIARRELLPLNDNKYKQARNVVRPWVAHLVSTPSMIPWADLEGPCKKLVDWVATFGMKLSYRGAIQIVCSVITDVSHRRDKKKKEIEAVTEQRAEKLANERFHHYVSGPNSLAAWQERALRAEERALRAEAKLARLESSVNVNFSGSGGSNHAHGVNNFVGPQAGGVATSSKPTVNNYPRAASSASSTRAAERPVNSVPSSLPSSATTESRGYYMPRAEMTASPGPASWSGSRSLSRTGTSMASPSSSMSSMSMSTLQIRPIDDIGPVPFMEGFDDPATRDTNSDHHSDESIDVSMESESYGSPQPEIITSVNPSSLPASSVNPPTSLTRAPSTAASAAAPPTAESASLGLLNRASSVLPSTTAAPLPPGFSPCPKYDSSGLNNLMANEGLSTIILTFRGEIKKDGTVQPVEDGFQKAVANGVVRRVNHNNYAIPTCLGSPVGYALMSDFCVSGEDKRDLECRVDSAAVSKDKRGDFVGGDTGKIYVTVGELVAAKEQVYVWHQYIAPRAPSASKRKKSTAKPSVVKPSKKPAARKSGKKK